MVSKTQWRSLPKDVVYIHFIKDIKEFHRWTRLEISGL